VRRDGAPAAGRFIDVRPSEPFLVTAKPAEDGRGVIVRVQNVTGRPQVCALGFPELSPVSARLASPVEADGAALAVTAGESGPQVSLDVPARAVQTLRVEF
jgi:hypothetical protein